MWKADLNWLPVSIKKSVPEPKIIWEESSKQQYGGFYTLGTKCLTIVQNDTFISTIAHEFKHYLQFQERGYWSPARLNFSLCYDDMITDYFTNNHEEFEALLFEYKYAKDYCNEWWLRKLVLEKL